MLVCNYCGTVRSGEELRSYVQIHDYTDLQPLKERVADYTCEECGRGDYVEAKRCKVCGVWFNDEDCAGICDNCLDESVTFENAVKYGRQNTESVEINGLFAHIFSAEKINDIIEQYAEQHYTDGCREIAGYCEYDKACFADFVAEG